ncbi:hypothetical protein [Nocardioides pacificus]
MELIDVSQRLTRDLHNIVVSHARTSLTRGLELGEDVVVRDAEGRRRSASVTGFEFTEDDTLYVLVLGASVRGEDDDRPAQRTSVDDVVDMLEEIRRQRRAPEREHTDPLARILSHV